MRRYRVEYTERAIDDIDQIRQWIARDSPERARMFVRQLLDLAGSLDLMPERCPAIPGRPLSDRRLIYRDYLILFRIEAEAVAILRVLHGGRDWQGMA